MTQTSPKPADQINTNIHKPKSPTNSYVDGHTTLNLEKLIPDTKTLKPKPKLSSVLVWQGLRQWWDNLNFRSKLAILLVGSAALPVIGVTQGIVAVTKERLSLNFKQSLQKEEHLFIEDYVLWNVSEGEIEADTIAKFVQSIKIDLSNPSQLANQRDLLQTFINQFKVLEESGSVEKNIRIITDAQGRTVAQNIQTLAEDSFNYPPEKVEMNPRYRPVSLPLGIYLGDIPIVKDALRTGKTLSGIELFKGEVLQRLGQEKQANIGLRTQPTQGLTQSEQPFPPGTYDIDGGRAGLVGIAVHPIKIGNKLVGTVIVGSLMNRSSVLVDSVKVRENVPFSTVFAQDWRVSTNVPYSDRQTRDIGTRAPRKVAQTVLNQGQEFIGPTKIGGVDYLAVYQPLYDHQKQLNPTGASPVGMVFVGRPRAESESLLAKQEVIGFSIGGSMLLLAGLVALPIASSFSRPLRRLAGFAQQVGAGEQGVRLESTERQDEIGVLSQELNKMATSIELNLEARRQEAERAQLFADITARARESQDLELVFNNAVEKAREMLNADRVVVYRFNADWSGYIKAESVVSGWPQALADKIDDACIPEELIEAYRKGRVVATNNVFETDYSPDHIKLLERLQIKANLVTPILQNDQLFGLLIAHQCDRPHIWQQSEVNFLTQLAVQLGLILDRVTFLEQQTTAKEQLQKRALELVMEVEPISSGDLTVQAQVSEDAIGTVADSYNATIGSLRQIVTQVQSAAKQVATTTSSSEVSVLELSAEALRQAQEITVALDRIEEMSDSIRAVAANAEQAEAAVQQATLRVKAGDAAMNRTVDGIMAIRETVAETSKKVKRLGESSQKISKVVNLISTFADKTNLLALNAAIEAANAGEQGRGFAVVADQVRALARQSAQATAEIESLVKDIQTETNAVVAAMEAGTEQVVAGTKLVDETRQSLNQITTVSAQIGALVDAIASAAAAQSQVSESVTETMSDMAAIAQHTSNEATVVSASFKELQAVAQQLQASVGQFKVS